MGTAFPSDCVSSNACQITALHVAGSENIFHHPGFTGHHWVAVDVTPDQTETGVPTSGMGSCTEVGGDPVHAPAYLWQLLSL